MYFKDNGIYANKLQSVIFFKVDILDLCVNTKGMKLLLNLFFLIFTCFIKNNNKCFKGWECKGVRAEGEGREQRTDK